MQVLTTGVVQAVVGSKENVLVTRRQKSVECAARCRYWSFITVIETRAEPCQTSFDYGDGLSVILTHRLLVYQDAASVNMLR